MNAIYLGSGQSINDQVVGINGITGSYGTLSDVTCSHTSFMWGLWSCADGIPCCDSTITSMSLVDSMNTPYIATFSALVGGRPPRPIAK